jgi:signal transduction histidine kinase
MDKSNPSGNPVWRWLGATPNEDDIDRRNGAFFQLFLLYFFVNIFTSEPQKYWNSDIQNAYMAKAWGAVLPWPRIGMIVDFATDFLMGFICVVAFVVVRQGRFRAAVKLFLGWLLGLLALSTLVFGSVSGTHYFGLTLIIAALMLGRRALWSVYAALVLVFSLGLAADSFADLYRTGHLGFKWRDIISVAVNEFVIAALLDQTVKAIRDSLAKAEARGDRLAAEIVEREKTQRQVVHLEKMRVIGQLASGTAHDFNNVLGVILGFARERRRPTAEAPTTQREVALSEALEGIEVAARRGASVSRKLLDFSRTETAPSRSFDVARALEDVRPMLRQLLPDNVRLSIDAPPGATLALFNSDHFELALLNFAANARDAMPRGGACTIKLMHEANELISVTIEDSGEGMSDETKQRVFEPFFTTKPVGVGTGLGLSVVHGLVERSGGRMSIQSALGQGTSITMWLPQGSADETNSAPPQSDDIKVLLIDDDDVLRGILVSSLEDYGFEVKAAHDGRSALQCADAMHEPPHVVVIDHHMPDMDGATVMRHLRERFPDVPAILISTNAPPPGGSASEARTYRLPKPFSPDRLATQIVDIVTDSRPN